MRGVVGHQESGQQRERHQERFRQTPEQLLVRRRECRPLFNDAFVESTSYQVAEAHRGGPRDRRPAGAGRALEFAYEQVGHRCAVLVAQVTWHRDGQEAVYATPRLMPRLRALGMVHAPRTCGMSRARARRAIASSRALSVSRAVRPVPVIR